MRLSSKFAEDQWVKAREGADLSTSHRRASPRFRLDPRVKPEDDDGMKAGPQSQTLTISRDVHISASVG